MTFEPIDIGSRPQLFLDDHLVDSTADVQRQLHRPTRHEGNPILRADMPWEQGGNGVYLYGGTVMFDEEDGVFKMWYRTASVDRDVSGGKSSEVEGAYKACYAVSEDGLRWERQPLGLVEYGGSTDNNMLPPAQGTMSHIRRPNLLKDYAEPDPRRRYKIAYMDRIDGRWGLCQGYSPDGIHWTMNVGEPSFFARPVAPNGILFGWDPRMRKFVHYHRKSQSVRADVDGRVARSRVATVRSTSEDFSDWGDTRDVIWKSEADPPGWSPAHGVDLAAVLYTEELYVGFVDSCSTHWVEDVPAEAWDAYRGEFADYRTELLISRDGDDWTRVAPHWEFMRPGLWGTWDSSLVGLAKPIVLDDEILIYYTGSNLPGGVAHENHPQHELVHKVVDGQRLGFAIGVARMRRDGFASMEGYEPTGTLTTRPLVFDGDSLVINARAPDRPFGADSTPATPFGRLRVELLDAAGEPLTGFSADDFDVFTGDDVRHVATWRGGDGLRSLGRQPVRLRFHLTNAALYSFRFRRATEDPTPMNLLAPGARGRAPTPAPAPERDS